MNFIVDIVIIAFIILCVILGYRKGLANSLLHIVSFVLALVISLVLFRPVSNIVIENTPIDEKLETSIHNFITNTKSEEQEENIKEENINQKEDNGNKKENENETEKEKFENAPKIVQEYINKVIENVGNETKESIADAISQSIAVDIIQIGVLICLFILLRIVLIFIRGLTKLITKIPVIKQFDKLGGIIYGLLKALIIIYVILAVLSFISPMLRNSKIVEAVNQSIVGNMLYNNNLILKLLL